MRYNDIDLLNTVGGRRKIQQMKAIETFCFLWLRSAPILAKSKPMSEAIVAEEGLGDIVLHPTVCYSLACNLTSGTFL